MKKHLLPFLAALIVSMAAYAQAPVITSFTPASGPPGTLVTINGSNLSSPTAFSIGGVSAIVVSDSGTKLVGYVMPGATTGAVSITTGGGTVNSSSNFTVTPTSYPSVVLSNYLIGTGYIFESPYNNAILEGQAVAISADGMTAAVGGEDDSGGIGAVWIFTRTAGLWTQQGAKLVGTHLRTTEVYEGCSVALSADGNTVLFGGWGEATPGAAWVFTRSDTTWTQQAKLAGTGWVTSSGYVRQGWSVSLSADGNTAVVGGPLDGNGIQQGAAWIFIRSGNAWSQQGSKLVGTGSSGSTIQQGSSVSISADGNTAIIGGPNDDNNLGAAWVFTRLDTTWTQQGSKLFGTGFTGIAHPKEGYSVALSANGNTAIVGGPVDTFNSSGISLGVGAVWIFTRSSNNWTQQGSKLVGSDMAGTGTLFGGAVSLSADGNVALIGGPYDNTDIGAVWLFTRSDTTWTQQGNKLVPGAGLSGWSVSLTGDGTSSIIGSPISDGTGAAWVFVDSALSIPTPTITSFTPASGPPGTLVTIIGTNLDSITGITIGDTGALLISTSGSGDTIVGYVMPGAVTGPITITTAYGTATSSSNFTVTPTPYPAVQQGGKLVGTGWVSTSNYPVEQGYATAISADGNTAIIGGALDNSEIGAAWVFTRNNTTWSQQGPKLVGSGYIGTPLQGQSVAISADGNTALVGGSFDSSDKGAVWVFSRSGNVWSQEAKLVGSGAIGQALQGASVALSADGNTAIVGGYGDSIYRGAAWIFRRNGSTWSQQGSKLVGSGYVWSDTGIYTFVYQGQSVAISADGKTSMIGGFQDNNGIGAAWVFTSNGTNWVQQGLKLVGSGYEDRAGQGRSVSLSADGNTAIVGGPGDSSVRGAAWVFMRSGTNWVQQGSKLIGTGYSHDSTEAEEGNSVSISADGNTAIISGAEDNNFTGATWVFTRNGNNWAQQGTKLLGTGGIGKTNQGFSSALSANGTTAIVGAPGDSLNRGATWVFISAPQPQGSLTANGPFCGSGTGQLNFTATAGTGPFTVVYNDGSSNHTVTGVVSGTAFNAFTNPVTTTTTYTLVSVGDNNGDSTRYAGFTGDTAIITINPNITAGITGNTSGCGAVLLTATGGTSYAWSGGNSTNTASNTFLSSGTYTVTVTGSGGCSATASQVVTVYTAITAGITGVSTGCGSVSLYAVGGTGYTWSGGNSPNTIADTFTTSGTYTVTVTGDGGCSGTASRLVTVDTIPNATITPNGPTTFCSGDSVILSANTESSYLWSTNATAQSITVKQSGSYTVTVTSLYNCTAASNATVVTVNSLPSATITPNGPTTFCTGDSVILSANTESSYLWNTSASTQSITVKLSGNSTVTVTDANGCKAASTAVSVTVNTSIVPSITITASPSGPVCAGATITFRSTVSGQGSSPAYSWRVNGVNTGVTTDSVSTNQLQNNNVVTCLLTSSAGCASPDTALSNSITVTVNPVVTPTISLLASPSSVCAGSADTIAATVTNGGNAAVYDWLLNNQPVNNTRSIYISDSLQSGNAVKCVLVSNAACAQPDTVTSNSVSVTVNPAPNATITPSGTVSVCQGDSVELSAAAGNTGYVWNTHATSQNIYVQFAANYTVTVTNLNNCTAVSAPVTVVVNSSPATPTISQSHDTLTSSAATTYQWFLNDTAINNSTNRTLLITRTGTYTVQITDSNGCSNTSAGLNIKTLGINDVANAYGVQLYPNPNNGNFTIEFTDDVLREIEITDAIGRIMMPPTKIERQKNFNLDALAAGIYILRITQNTEVNSLKFSVVK